MQVGEPCGALLEAVFGVVDDALALALFGRDGSLVCASPTFLDVVGGRSLRLAELLGDDGVADLRRAAPGIGTRVRLTVGAGDWEGRARPVTVAGRRGHVVALRRHATEELPSLDLDTSPASAEDSWHRVSRRSLETMALGRALEDLPVGMALIESTTSGGFEVIAKNGAYATLLPVVDARDGSCAPRAAAFAADQTTALTADDWPGVEAARTERVVREREIRTVGPDGNWRILHASAAPVVSSDGTRRSLELVMDVTDGVRGHELGALSQARYASVFASCNDCLLVARYDVCAETFHVQEANDPLLTWLGRGRERVIGESLSSTLASLGELDSHLRDVLATGLPYSAELEVGERHCLTRVVRVSSFEVAISVVDTTSVRVAEREARQLAARHARTAETVPGVLYDYRVEPDGRVVFEYVSPRAGQVLGHDADALLADGDVLWARIGSHERNVVFRGHGSSGGGAEEVCFVASDRRRRYLRFCWASDDASQGITRGSGVIFDVTEATLVRSQLLRSRHELFELLARLPLGVFVERDGRVVFANAVFASLAGRPSPLDLLGLSVVEIFGLPVDGVEGPLEGEARLVRADGTSVDLEVSARREVVLEGQSAALWTVRDLTELREMRVRLARADRLACVGMLAAGVAHEINNPLAYLIAALEHLRESRGDLATPETVGALAEAWEGANRVRQVVRDLKCFSRPDLGRPSRVDVHAMLDSASNMASHELRPRARLTKDYGDLPPVLANESRLAQVFLNLIVNAAQSIRPGAPSENAVVLRTGTDSRGWVVVEISDTGEGIPDTALRRVFEPFFSTKVERGGTGLGLAISKTTIDSMGGRIEIESSVGEGTTVRVRLRPAPPPASGRRTERPTPFGIPHRVDSPARPVRMREPVGG